MKVVVLVRLLQGGVPYWHKYATVNSLAEANALWEKKIKSKGVTSWTEFVTQKKAKEMMKSNPQ